MKQYIVLHHSASPDGTIRKDFENIKNYHLAKGWRDIGYHWVIEKVGGKLTVIPGRPEAEPGAHCVPRNKDGIGVCCVGDYDKEKPDEELYQVVARLCREIMGRHSIKEIGGHNQYAQTICPGRYFDVGRVRQLVKEGETARSVIIEVKGKKIEGKIIDGQTWCPVRQLVETLTHEVTWNNKQGRVIIE